MNKLGRFLTNFYDPTKAGAKEHFTFATEQGGHDREWQRHLDYINSNIIGPPKASKKYTVEVLEANNLLGLYAESEN